MDSADISYVTLAGQKVSLQNAANFSTIEMAKAIADIKRSNNDEDPFLVVNLNTLVERYELWRSKLPRVRPFYAVKCNHDPAILSVLATLGLGFDCASKGEIDKIIKIGVDPTSRIVYANPYKQRDFIRHASQIGVQLMTFDSAEELFKVKEEHNNPQMMLRFAIDDPAALCPFSKKFGCDPPLEEGTKLLRLAKQLDIPIVGICFHVGTGVQTPSIFWDALKMARALFDIGLNLGHTELRILDIGGGFPGVDTEEVSFHKIVDVLGPALDEFFPASANNVDIISEPGRFFGAPAVAEVVNVIARKRVNASRILNSYDNTTSIESININKTKNWENDLKTQSGFMYYINDGLHGAFNCFLHKLTVPMNGIPLKMNENLIKYPTTIWGPTCNGRDQVEMSTNLCELQVGDWLYYPNMGAYSSVGSSTFNGFDKAESYYVINNEIWRMLFAQPPRRASCIMEAEGTCVLNHGKHLRDSATA